LTAAEFVETYCINATVAGGSGAPRRCVVASLNDPPRIGRPATRPNGGPSSGQPRAYAGRAAFKLRTALKSSWPLLRLGYRSSPKGFVDHEQTRDPCFGTPPYSPRLAGLLLAAGLAAYTSLALAHWSCRSGANCRRRTARRETAVCGHRKAALPAKRLLE